MARYKCSGIHRKDEDGAAFCTYEADKRWLGRCPGCGRFYSITTKGEEDENPEATFAALGQRPVAKRISSGIPQVDRLFGGGLVIGQQVLIAGQQGVGKTTLLLQLCEAITVATGRPALYTAGEMSTDDIATFASRMELKAEHVHVMGNECDVYKIVNRAEQLKPVMLIVDSINTAVVDDAGGDVGSNEQILAAAKYLNSFGKTTRTMCFYIVQLLKNDDVSGPRTLQHLVDTICNFDMAWEYDEEGGVREATKHLRTLSIPEKNRFGETMVSETLEMTAKGLMPPSRSNLIRFPHGR
jgi:DNA repair protein RadA/Sms